MTVIMLGGWKRKLPYHFFQEVTPNPIGVHQFSLEEGGSGIFGSQHPALWS